MEQLISFIALIIVAVGVVMVYNARIITKRLFGFGDQNQAAWGLKILGFIVAIIGALIIYFNIR
mgnify:CR=1 FL=1